MNEHFDLDPQAPRRKQISMPGGVPLVLPDTNRDDEPSLLVRVFGHAVMWITGALLGSLAVWAIVEIWRAILGG